MYFRLLYSPLFHKFRYASLKYDLMSYYVFNLKLLLCFNSVHYHLKHLFLSPPN